MGYTTDFFGEIEIAPPLNQAEREFLIEHPDCQWIPGDDGASLEWDGVEKFYEAENWMAYIIDHFLKPGAEASKTGDPQFEQFSFDHILNGDIDAQGEEPSDLWLLRVKDNSVFVLSGEVAYHNPQLVTSHPVG